MSDDCVFCDPARLPVDKESMLAPGGRRVWVFEPLNPVVPGHLLVVPEAHFRDASADPWAAAAAMDIAARVARQYESANIITSIGSAATQSVFHLHLHVVPRAEGDGLPLPWTPQQQREKHGQDAIPQSNREPIRIADHVNLHIRKSDVFPPET